ncbi:putative FAS-associated death domain protein-like [Apostichopus japonicus]|uniref:Putative FAS-associated death domain protein-like n=1 Tax=Stichopus japonicus TaxID=307972 RepID=A0A2G8LQ14_STIJA|nr:putative FAS-associated death domain protein-like [Apostichopus japonicus]
MGDRETNYRTVLADVADELKDDDAKRLAFELPIPPAERDKIINGRMLIDEMERIKMISDDNVDQLLEKLKKRHHNVAATKLEGYRKNHITSPESESGDMLPEDKRVDERFLETLSEQFTREWKDVGRGLGITDAKLESFQEDNPTRRKDAILEMLKYWWRNNGKKATYYVLAEAFKKAHRVDLQEEVLKYG